MMKIRKAGERGGSNLGWLNSQHSFSFGHYHDPAHMGFESLRVINDDRVAPGQGFGTHPHSDMEIISYVLDGELEHKDSMGNGSVICPGEVQRLSAGTGMTHSEYNHSNENEVHFLQIWFQPDLLGVEPGYEQQFFDDDSKRGRFRLVASRLSREGSVSLNQDVDMLVALVDGNEEAIYEVEMGRSVWVQIARGQVELNGTELSAGDGVAIKAEPKLVFSNGIDAEVIVFSIKPVS